MVGPLCLVVVGPLVFKKVMACTTKVQATYNPFRVLMERRGLPPALFKCYKDSDYFVFYKRFEQLF